MRVLIAGCGDVGSVLATSLLREGHTVFGLKRDTSSLPGGVQPVQADLLNPDTLMNLPSEIDALVFLPTPATRDQAGYEAIFIQGWKNVWAALKQAPGRTLVVSSTAVYGESAGGMVDEKTAPDPTGFNGKVLLEMEQLAAGCTENLIVVRISGIYGPGRERLISMAASEGLEVQQSPPFFTNRIHRDDAAAALMKLQDWSLASGVLEEFRTIHPEHELQAEATKQLAFIYREDGQVERSAAEHERIAAESTDPELRRDLPN